MAAVAAVALALLRGRRRVRLHFTTDHADAAASFVGVSQKAGTTTILDKNSPMRLVHASRCVTALPFGRGVDIY